VIRPEHSLPMFWTFGDVLPPSGTNTDSTVGTDGPFTNTINRLVLVLKAR
jgi:hypothetical protein